MTTASQSAKPLWVKQTCWALGLTLGAPILASLIFRAHTAAWQLAALLVAGLWLAACGYFTDATPLPMARYFARPGTYELMLNHPSRIATWYLRFAGAFMLLLGLAIAAAAALLLTPKGAHV